MYQPAQHREDRIEILHQLIEAFPLALLVSTGDEGPVANAFPFLLQRHVGPFGTLQCHMSRGNSQWRNIDGQKVLIVFQGPQNYISPNHYATKSETGKVVPTWNYVMVQARGVAMVRTDSAWLDAQVSALTSRHEQTTRTPWAVSDAPRDFIESQLRGIVGLEIRIDAIDGKWKVSQNRPQADRRGVAEGVASENPAMAELVRRYGNV